MPASGASKLSEANVMELGSNIQAHSCICELLLTLVTFFIINLGRSCYATQISL